MDSLVTTQKQNPTLKLKLFTSEQALTPVVITELIQIYNLMLNTRATV